MSPQWPLSLRFPHQDPIFSPLLTHTRHLPSPSHSSQFYHPLLLTRLQFFFSCTCLFIFQETSCYLWLYLVTLSVAQM
jgi:hypothetical protein